MIRNPFNPRKAARSLLWIVLAAVIAIVSLGRDLDLETLTPASLTISTTAITLLAFLKIAFGWLRKSVPAEHRTGILAFLNLFTVPLACAIALAGCISVPWDANPLKSSDRIIVDESSEGDFKLTIKGSGHGVFSRDFHYQGSGQDPWIMTVAATSEIASPALTLSLDVLGAAVAQLPTLLDVLGPMPDQPDAQLTWTARLFGFLGNNPSLLPSFLELLLRP